MINILFENIKKIAKKENCIFLRLEPESKIWNLESKIYKTIDLEPARTSMLDLSRSEEEILKSMHQKTRYNIHLAEKKGVEIREGNKEDFEEFWKIMKETSDRDGFRTHTKKHYQKMISLDGVKLTVAVFEDKIIAGTITTFFGDTAVYAHGASSNEYRNAMAPFLLQWQAIKIAKTKGLKYYDFFGMDEVKWPGVTRFKKGFGGYEKEYPGTYDLVFNLVWYNGYKILRQVRRLF